MQKIKIGDWVVDDEGDICQVERIDYDTNNRGENDFTEWVRDNFPNVYKTYIKNKENDLEPSDEIWGKWESARNNRNIDSRRLLCTEREYIKGAYPTKEVAMIHASVINADLENNDEKELP